MVTINSKTKTTIKRAIAFAIDWNLIFIISLVIFLSGPNFDPKYLLVPSTEMFSMFNVFLGILSFMVLPLVKDLMFKNASIGKLIMGIRVVNADDGSQPSTINLIKRNIAFYFPPIELISFLIKGGKTIGDIISNTIVVEKKKD